MVLFGENGSGKTTTISCLMGLLPITCSDYKIFDKKLFELFDDEKQQIGIVDLNINAFKVYKNANSIMKFCKSIYNNFDCNVYLRLIKEFNIPLNKTVYSFSTGEYEKFQFAVDLSHNTKILFIDESTALIDQLMKDVIFDELK